MQDASLHIADLSAHTPMIQQYESHDWRGLQRIRRKLYARTYARDLRLPSQSRRLKVSVIHESRKMKIHTAVIETIRRDLGPAAVLEFRQLEDEPPSASRTERISQINSLGRVFLKLEKTMAEARKVWNIPADQEVPLC